MTDIPAPLQRVINERDELLDRLAKLKEFFSSALFGGLEDGERADMHAQAHHMTAYGEALTRRLLRAGVAL